MTIPISELDPKKRYLLKFPSNNHNGWHSRRTETYHVWRGHSIMHYLKHWKDDVPIILREVDANQTAGQFKEAMSKFE